MDMSQYLQIFIEESNDNLQSLNEHLLVLENEPDNKQVLNEIFRVAHTLKGMAGTMGYVRMQKLTHSIENVLSEIRNGKIHVNSDMVDILFQCLDALENYVQQITTTSQEGNNDYPELVAQLEQIIATTTQAAPVQAQPADNAPAQTTTVTEGNVEITLPEAQKHVVEEAMRQGLNVYGVRVVLSSTCVLKSARSFIIFKDLEAMGEVIHSVPEVQDIEDEKFDDSFELVVVTEHSKEQIEKSVLSVTEVEAAIVQPLAAIAQTVADGTSNGTDADSTSSEAAKHEEGSDDAPKVNKPAVAAKSVRVNIERLDTLMNLVSELIIVKTQLEGAKDQRQENLQDTTSYSDSVEYLERVTSNLHDAVMKVRMVPVETVFNRFPRMLRDVSRKLNKDIELIMSGEETELDRTVIDEIGDPLIHLLRNAADHGLETTEERKRLGKNPKGTIKLQAYQDGNSVVIEVGDDGKGIDAATIKQKSIKKGLLTKEEADTLSDKEIIDYLFKPGFSTSETITDLSGRGVGLDVVKSKITALGGHVEVNTEVGKGSTFIVRLPLTLAIIQALMVKLGEEKYAIPLGNIQNIEDIRSQDIRMVQKQEVIVLRNEVIPIVRLHTILGVEEIERETMMAVIIKKGEKQIGFIIDTLIGQQEIVIKPLGKYLNHINMIAGATILGNGEVALILDINTLV